MSLFFNDTNAETLNRLILAGSNISLSIVGSQLQINATGIPSNAFINNGNAFSTLATLGTTDANDLRFIRNSTEIMRINATGLGIATTNPLAALDINDNGSGQLTRFKLRTSGFAHNFTGITQADVYGLHGWWNGTLGGYFMGGFSKDGTNPAYVFVGYSGATGTVSYSCFEYRAAKRSGVTTTALTSSDVHTIFTNNGTTVATLMGTGFFNIGGTAQPTSTLFVNGSVGKVLATKTAAYSLTSTDSYIVVTSGTHTQTLPTAVGCSGREYTIWNKGTGIVTIATTSSQTIGNEPTGNPTTYVIKKSEWLTVVSDGANWLIA